MVFIKKRLASFLVVLAGGLGLVFALASPTVYAGAGTNQQLSFTGKLTDQGSSAVADSTYNVEFKIYKDGNSSGVGSTLVWTEDWLVSGSTGMPSTGGVTTFGGTFQVNLGSICSFSGGTCGNKTNTGVDFNQQTLWLSINLGNTSSCTVTSSTTSFNSTSAGGCHGDGEMTPLIRLTAVPQALNSDLLDGVDSSGFVQLGASQSGNINIGSGSVTAGTFTGSGAITLSSGGSGDITLDSASNVIQIAATDTTLQRQASGNYTIDLKSASNTTKLAVTNSGSSGIAIISAQNGYQINGATASAGHYLRGDGTSFTDSSLLYSDLTSYPSACASGSAITALASSPTCGAFIQNQSGSAQSSSNFHISGNGSADTSFISPLFDSQSSGNSLGIGTTNAGAITFGNAINTTGVTFATQNVATAYQFQNNNGEPIFLIDTQGKDNNANTNLIKNPGFEAGVSGWNGANTNCQTITKNTTLSNVYNGVASADCLTASSGTTTITVSQFNATLPAGPYNFSFYAKGGAAITLSTTVTFTGGGVNCTNLSPTSVTTTGFQRFSCSVTTTGATTDIRMTTTTTSQHLYLDAAQLTPTLTLTPYRMGNIQFRGVVNNPVAFQAVSNSVNAFQIQDASGNQEFNIDTYSSTVSLGITGAVATAGVINIGTSSGATQNVTIGSTSASSTVNIVGGTSGNNITVGSTGSSALSSNVHIQDTSDATGTQATVVGSNANAANSVDIDAGNTGQIEIGDTTSAHTIKIGAGGTAAGSAEAITIGSASTTTAASTVTLQGSNITTSNGNAGIIIGGGFSTSDTNLVPLTLDSTTTFSETANTCTTSVNDGALYFNANTGSMAIRACINGGWEDLVSTAGAFFSFFGVVPDSGSATAVPGDIQSLSTANSTGPCRVYWVANGSTSQVGVRDCTAYSGGRKVSVAAATLNITAANNNFFHICLSGTNNQPVVSAGSTTESANLGTVSFPSATAPILCLADVKTSSNAITGIYDTRIFTTTTKEFGYSAAALPLGVMVKPDSTNANRLNLPGTTATGQMRGIVVASNGAAWASGGPNIIIATSGDVFVKATAGSPSQTTTVQNSTTTSGYALTATAVTTTYANLGVAQTTFSNTCTSVSTCNSSLLLSLNIK